ncbi:MAG: hypothetical protein O9302_09845 [Cyclobacteriaceae bacterium]|jgi:hypothetical protein|nr:hypothetical protein [Cytophagales bacterium]MCZ8328349.1 hypothetical protein [Cyclobacteriaceae bacterium]
MSVGKNFKREDVWRYLDHDMSEEEKIVFLAAVKTDKNLEKILEEENLIRLHFTRIKLSEPSAGFTNLVMEKIQKVQGEFSISIKRSMLLLAGVLVVTLLTAFLVSKGIFDSPGTIKLPEVNPVVNQYLPNMPEASQFTINNKIVVNGIIILNLIIGFVLLDRTVLRPFFQKRMRHS